MKFSARLAAFLLATLFVLTAFVGCTTPPTDDPLASQTDLTTEITEAPGIDLELGADALKEYVIVRAEKTSDAIINAAAQLRLDLNAAIDTEVRIMTDWIKNVEEIPASAKEIVVGVTNRPETEEIVKDLRENDFAIVYKNERIFIIGGNDAATLEALDYFMENHVDAEKKLLKINDKLNHVSLYSYPLAKVEINGVSIRDYTVVIPENADLSTLYAAANLSDFFLTNAGFEMTITSDKEAETDYEILIGDTNRSASTVSVSPDFKKSEYVLCKTGNKIVCQGDSYMVGGGVGDLVSRLPLDGKNAEVKIDDLPTDAAVKTFTFKEAKSAILMIGDGMGFNTIEMALPQIGSFVANDLPNKGNAYTGSVTTQGNPTKPTDSAASGTALATGVKTINGYIGVDKNKNDLLNLRELAHSKGSNTGVITTDVITGATPSSFLAHAGSRNDTSELKAQIDALIKDGKVDWATGGDSKADTKFDSELIDNTTGALRLLSTGGASFFLMIEEGHIDKRSHKNDAAGCINMVERFNDTIAYVIQFVLCHPDTALVITADHETGGITKQADGTFKYTLDDHSTANVPTFAIGSGTEYFNGKEVDNTDIPKFLAKIYGENSFGSEIT